MTISRALTSPLKTCPMSGEFWPIIESGVGTRYEYIQTVCRWN